MENMMEDKLIFTPRSCYKKRVGVLGKKIGMTRLKLGEKMKAVTMISLDGCRVVSHITEDQRGYTAVQMGLKHSKNIAKAQTVMFEKNNLEPVSCLKEFRVMELKDVPGVGTEMKADYFELGQRVDVCGTSMGKGFAGGMKRHNFHGLRASHGVSITHRSLGSTGNRTEPGRVFKGRKMPGRLGGERSTVQNLQIVYVSAEHNVIGVAGSVPGNPKGIVTVRDTVLGKSK